ncbi:MAG: nuclear transport factor 2 family protein [Sphingomicrobium sp.]
MRSSLYIAAAALALVSCQKAGVTPPVTEAEAIKIAESAEATFTAGDLDKIMGQYANGAAMIDAGDPNPSTDRKVQTGWARNFTSMKPLDYEVASRQTRILGPDAFVTSGMESFTVEAGAARPRVNARFTDVYQRQKDGSWKIVAEHMSMPPTPVAPPAG